MKWTDSIRNKLLASIILLALCLLVMLSNYLDRIHTQNVKHSISTMYEDRLVVEAYILKMTQNVYQIREVLNTGAVEQKVNSVEALTKDLKATYIIFIQTRLTTKEKSTADELVTQIRGFEQIIVENHEKAYTYTDRILFSLNQLSDIQLAESKQIMDKVESQYTTIKALSQFAFAIIIVILIVLQVLVFSGESIIPIFKPKDPTLN